MDKITYLAELAEGLARWVPERERQDILRYYAEYFEEAGPEREAEVVAELGDPEALSYRLAVEGGYVTPEKAASWRHRVKWPRILIGAAVSLSIFTLVFLIVIGLLAFNSVRFVSDDPVLDTTEAMITDAPMSGQAPDGTVTIADSEYIAFVEGSVLEEFAFIEDGSLEAFSSIDVDIGLGNIEVLAGDNYTLSIRRSEAFRDYELTWGVKDGAFRLRDNSRSHWGRVENWGKWVVEVTITVPEGTALNKVSVKTGLGDVLLSGVSAETVTAETGLGDVLLYGVNADTVTAETGLGDVECYEARSVRKLNLGTGLGDVSLGLEEVSSGLDIELDSGMGNVEVSLDCSENDCSYGLESGMGTVTVNGIGRGGKAERRDSAPYRLYAESGMGNVNVYFTLG